MSIQNISTWIKRQGTGLMITSRSLHERSVKYELLFSAHKNIIPVLYHWIQRKMDKTFWKHYVIEEELLMCDDLACGECVFLLDVLKP